MASRRIRKPLKSIQKWRFFEDQHVLCRFKPFHWRVKWSLGLKILGLVNGIILFYPNWGSHILQGTSASPYPTLVHHISHQTVQKRQKKTCFPFNCCNCLLLFSSAFTFLYVPFFISINIFSWWNMSIIQCCLCISVIYICLISLTFQAKKGQSCSDWDTANP